MALKKTVGGGLERIEQQRKQLQLDQTEGRELDKVQRDDGKVSIGALEARADQGVKALELRGRTLGNKGGGGSYLGATTQRDLGRSSMGVYIEHKAQAGGKDSNADLGTHEDYPQRSSAPADQVSWNVAADGYQPVEDFTHPDVAEQPVWADPPTDQVDWAAVAVRAEEVSVHKVRIDPEGRPLNPLGRTGITGRGILGKWGPNPAADPLVTRINDDGKLEILLIRRKDSHKLALPGGMVDPGESVSRAAARELGEEANVKLGFADAPTIYQGYVKDPRNTDNAWMETTVKHLHLNQRAASQIKPEPGDDADRAGWQVLDAELIGELYASHGDFVAQALRGLVTGGKLSKDVKRQARRVLAMLQS